LTDKIGQLYGSSDIDRPLTSPKTDSQQSWKKSPSDQHSSAIHITTISPVISRVLKFRDQSYIAWLNNNHIVPLGYFLTADPPTICNPRSGKKRICGCANQRMLHQGYSWG